MKKIIYTFIFLLPLLLLSCSGSSDESEIEKQETKVNAEYITVDEYNKLLTLNSELESKITVLENSLSQLEEKHTSELIKIIEILYRVDDEITANAEWIEINDSNIFENEQNIKSNAKKIEFNTLLAHITDDMKDEIDFNEKQIKMNTNAIEEFCDEYLSDIWEIIETPSRWRECYVLTGRGK